MNIKSLPFKLRAIGLVLIMMSFSAYVRSAGTVVGWTLTSNNIANSGLPANASCTISHSSSVTVTYDANGASTDGWDIDNTVPTYWQSSAFSTLNIINVYVTAQMKSDDIGPKYFQIQYKVGAGTWTSAGLPIVLTSIQNSIGNIYLPTECSNKASVSIRFLQSNNIAINNPDNGELVQADAFSYIRQLDVNGDNPLPPTNQVSGISLVSVTPTTITVTANGGNGTHWILKMNKTNVFTDPVDNAILTADATYHNDIAGGEQVMANLPIGTTKITVTVGSATNPYYFRAYSYNYNDGLTRYNSTWISPPSTASNPKYCSLEIIHNPTATNITLTTASLGGTIDTPLRGIVSARGVYIGYTPGINETSTLKSTASTLGGTYSNLVSPITRSKTVYFKAFVTNESGTIMSEEGSFSNVPIFSGTGTWSDATKWNVNPDVPGLNGINGSSTLDLPVINGICTLAADVTVKSLTINPSKVLYINPLKALTLGSTGTLVNNGGTAGLVLKSDVTGTGSLLHYTNNIDATIQRYISGSSDLASKKYHLVSVPFNSTNYQSEVWLDSYLFTYIENTNGWFVWDHPTTNTLQTHEGAMVFYPNWSGTTSKTYSMTGQLNNGTYSPTVVYSGATFGFNLVPNPYPSAIDWNAASGWTKTNISPIIWGFSPSDQNYGSWNGSTGTNNMSRYIPVGQAFFAIATSASPVLSMNNSVRLNSAQAFLKTDDIIPNIFHFVAAGNGGQDEIAVQFASDATAMASDVYDAKKLYADLTVPQLSTFTSDDATPLSITGLPINEGSTLVPLRLEMDYTGELTFTASAMESFNSTSIKLEDKQLTQMIDLRANPVYKFNHTGTDATDRFVLHFGSVTGTNPIEATLLSNVTVSGREVYMNYPVAANTQLNAAVYDLQGRMLTNVRLSGSGQDHLSLQTSGVYLIKLWLPTGVETHKIVVL